MTPPPTPAKPAKGSVFVGILLGAGLTALATIVVGPVLSLLIAAPNWVLARLRHEPAYATPLYSAVFNMSMWTVMAIGLVQWIYILPLGRHFLRRRETRTATGLLILALFVLATNAAYWIYLPHALNFSNWRF